MGAGSYTTERTFTVADIKRVLGSFAAEFDMVVASSGVGGWSRPELDETVADLVVFAQAKYISAIDVTLISAGGDEISAARYTVSEAAQGWTGDRPGNSLWPKTAGGQIRLTALLTTAWSNLGAQAKADFRTELNGSWAETDRDVSHEGLAAQFDRRFASNGFGLEKTTYGS